MSTLNQSVSPQAFAPAAIPSWRPLYWSVRRELWENRSLYLAPLAVAALALAGFAIGLVHLPPKMHDMAASPTADQAAVLREPYSFVAYLMMGTVLVLGIFYCLDALYGERRDRSVLFWKSLPVSDITTVLSKAVVAILIIPLLGWAVACVVQTAMLLASMLVVAGGGGLSVAALWSQLALPRLSLLLLYHMVAVHGLWYAPFYGWLLLASAWARRAPLLWATLPLLAIGLVEKIAFNSMHFAGMLQHRFLGDGASMSMSAPGDVLGPMVHATPGRFLTTPGLWAGFAVTAAFLAAAVLLRRRQAPV